jgi:ABC-2 type transport system ATP-binding protein
MTATEGISIENLTKTYRKGKIPALQGVSLSIQPGETFGIIGPNGAGKTTFLSCLLGLLFPDSGTISIDGYSPDDLKIRAVIGFLPERLNFDRWMTGFQFLRYHYRLARLPKESESEETQRVFSKVGLETSAGKQTIKKYSRGMLQRLGFAQALLGSPKYLFLDEPVSGVDPVGVMTFRGIIRELKEEGVTILLNSHQLDQVQKVCDRVAFINQGKVDAIEVLNAGAELKRVLRIRWTSGGNTLSNEKLSDVAKQTGAELLEIAPSEATFSVQSDANVVSLLKALLAQEVPIIEATPEEGRLERLFLDRKGSA